MNPDQYIPKPGDFDKLLKERFDSFRGKCGCRSNKEACSDCPSDQSFLAFIAQEREEAKREERAKNKKLLDALESMYEQYCADNGHLFMSAGESASAVMEEYGYGFDGGGRLIAYPEAAFEGTNKDV